MFSPLLLKNLKAQRVTNMAEIALVDCNNFFVSCEQLMNPDLLGKPVCVLSNNDGCVVARSNEAKKLGITMGMPLFMAKKQFKYAPVIYLSGRHELYRDISKRIMKKLSSFTPSVEVYSIDEAFLDLSGLKKLYRMSYKEIILKIKNEIKDEIGVPVSIGLAPTKTLAKLACEKAKKLPYTNGIYRIRLRNLEEEMQNTPIEEIWGVGKNTAALFHKYGIYKASEIVKQNDFWLNKIWGKRGIELKQELEGISVYPVIDKPALPKSIQRTSSFPKFSTDKNYIKTQLHIHLHDACRKLRKEKLKSEIIGVMLRTKDFLVMSDTIVLPQPTDNEIVIMEYADKLFEQLYRPEIIYRSSGIYAGKLSPAETTQLFLFRNEKDKKTEKLTQIWDKIEKKYGEKSLQIGTYFVQNE